MAEEFETVELEYSEDDILYYIEDEDGTEIGFALEEDGVEVEYYYEGFDAADYETVAEVPETAVQAAPDAPRKTSENSSGAAASGKAKDPGYLQKLAAIAGHEGNKARKAAGEKLDVVHGKVGEGIDKASDAAKAQATKAKAKADEADLGITREGIAETTADLNAIAKEGAETVKELKEAYDDIMENFGFMVPKKIRRKLP